MEIAGSVLDEVNSLNKAVGDPRLFQKYRRTLAASIHAEDLNFLLCCMKVDPRDRPSARELLQHEWLDDA